MNRLGLAALVCLAAATASTHALAGHANPWASDDDSVNSQYHEENLAQSEDTPGEDEMLGIMIQDAHGKLDDEPRQGGGD